MELKQEFKTYLEEAIGHENALVAFSAFDRPASVSVRMNPFKNACSLSEKQVLWNKYGCFLSERPSFTLDPVFHSGGYYVQDSSSMFVGEVFRRVLQRVNPKDRPLRVLDLCAAPGGKTTDLAASLREECGDCFLLVSNEVMKQRVSVLSDNVAIWGDPNVVVSSNDPRDFLALPGFFDIILADVPCSGEGMFRKDEEAVSQWSESNVDLCQARQRRIVADVWESLREGGMFIYSTCTFNRKENDENVAWIAEELGAEVCLGVADGFSGVLNTKTGYSLVPGFVDGEGQYCALLQKTVGEAVPSVKDMKVKRVSKGLQRVDRKQLALLPDMSELFTSEMTLIERNAKIIAVPALIFPALEYLYSRLHIISCGCAVGAVKGKDYIPDADLALSLVLNEKFFSVKDVDKRTALAFLHRDSVVLDDAARGYVLLKYNGLCLGFVKNLGQRCNNLHPQARRIRMDINL